MSFYFNIFIWIMCWSFLFICFLFFCLNFSNFSTSTFVFQVYLVAKKTF